MASKPFNAPTYQAVVIPVIDGTIETSQAIGFDDKAKATEHAKVRAADGITSIVYEAMIVFEAVTKVEAVWSRGAG